MSEPVCSKKRLRIQPISVGLVEAGGGVLLVGLPSSGAEPEGLEMNHGEGQLHSFGLQMRPDGRSHVCSSGRGWKQADAFLKGGVVRFGRRGGGGLLPEGSGWDGNSVLGGLYSPQLFDFG